MQKFILQKVKIKIKLMLKYKRNYLSPLHSFNFSVVLQKKFEKFKCVSPYFWCIQFAMNICLAQINLKALVFCHNVNISNYKYTSRKKIWMRWPFPVVPLAFCHQFLLWEWSKNTNLYFKVTAFSVYEKVCKEWSETFLQNDHLTSKDSLGLC